MSNNSYISLYQLPQSTEINSQDSILILRNGNINKMSYDAFIKTLIAPIFHTSSITITNTTGLSVEVDMVYTEVKDNMTYDLQAVCEHITLEPGATVTYSNILSQITHGKYLGIKVINCRQNDVCVGDTVNFTTTLLQNGDYECQFIDPEISAELNIQLIKQL